jgi:hypothetical protein
MTRPPLWEVMEQATGTVAEWDVVIRALRDWLVPEETFNGGGPPLLPDSDPRFIRWNKQRQIRLLLTEEADRAERGDA